MLTPSIVALAHARWNAILNPEPEEPEALAGVWANSNNDFVDGEDTYIQYVLTVDGDPINIAASNVSSIYNDTLDQAMTATVGSSTLRVLDSTPSAVWEITVTLNDETVISGTLTHTQAA